MLCFGSEWRRRGFFAHGMKSTVDRVNGGDRTEIGQMPGRCGEGAAESSSGTAARASPRRAKIKIFRKHGVRGKNGL